MTHDEQLELWAAGQSVHAEQCCPDFSCCKAELAQPIEIRRAFVAASGSERMTFLGAFLGAAMSLAAGEDVPKVHIAGPGEAS